MIDSKKAFDTVCHQRLILKLEQYGIRGVALELILSYLSNRKQFVNLKMDTSVQKNINIGVPQRSILGTFILCNLCY